MSSEGRWRPRRHFLMSCLQCVSKKVTQPNQSGNFCTGALSSRILRIFTHEKCKHRLTSEIVNNQSKIQRKHANCSLNHKLWPHNWPHTNNLQFWPSERNKMFSSIKKRFLMCSAPRFVCSLITTSPEASRSANGVYFAFQLSREANFMVTACAWDYNSPGFYPCF